MENNKLEQLTRKLYDDGLSKGRREAEELVEKARAEAKKIVDDAKSEAAKITQAAEQHAAETRSNTATETAIASRQAIAKLKDMIGSAITGSVLTQPIAAATLDAGFVKELLLAVASNWHGEKSELVALLPAAKEKELAAAFAGSVKSLLDAGVELKYSDAVKSGFRISPKDGGYYIGFTDDDFRVLLSEYLRPKLAKILYE